MSISAYKILRHINAEALEEEVMEHLRDTCPNLTYRWTLHGELNVTVAQNGSLIYTQVVTRTI